MSETMTQTEFAAHLGRAKSYVTALKQAGRLVFADDGRIDVAASLARIEATGNPARQGVADYHARQRQASPPPDDEDARGSALEKVGASYKLWQARKMKADAEIAEADRDERLRKLYPAHTVDYIVDDLAASVGQALDLLGHALAPDLVESERVPHAVAKIREHTDAIRRDLAERIAKHARDLRGEGS